MLCADGLLRLAVKGLGGHRLRRYTHMNKLKKIVAGIAVCAGVGCLGAAVGCNGEPDYYKLTFKGKGLDYVFQGALAPEGGDVFEANGYEVKSGVEVRFTLSLGTDTVGTPVIMLNGAEIKPDNDGVYSFIIDRDSEVTASGLQVKERITFSGGDWFKYYDEAGNLIDGDVAVIKGDEFKFKLWVSPYCKDTYTVTNDTEELTPDNDGFYTITGGTSTVNVVDIEQDESYLERGEGDGTEANPYIIRKPIDMYAVASTVNDTYSSDDSLAYYKLANDIDMRGEKLYVIGDNPDTGAIFCGHFDGNGKTISNFYIEDEFINQTSFARDYLQFTGLFGYACATIYGPAEIKNLTLKDYEVTIHPSKQSSGQASYAGSLVGFGIGVQIEGVRCENGKVYSEGDSNNLSYIGGIAGVLQSAYSDTTAGVTTYDAYIHGSYSDAEVSGSVGVRAAGGIAGILSTADTSAIAYITDTVSVGNVYGSMYAGGIVGSLGRFSSIANCYSSSDVIVTNNVVGAGIDASLKRAYAGGLVGYAENDSAISGCYSANGHLDATASSGASFSGKGDFVGYFDPALDAAVDSALYICSNSLAKADGHTAQTFTDVLGWNADEWDLNGDIPVFKGAESANKVTLTVKHGEGEIGKYEKNIKVPVPMYAWYQGDMPEYIDYSGKRSWGYYFDKELTQKVPCGYLPTADCELYVGFADYTEVAGTYHIGQSAYGDAAGITLDAEGGAYFRDGGMYLENAYSYDGNKITLYNTCLGALEYAADEVMGAYSTVIMEKAGDGYSLKGTVSVASYDAKGNVSYSTGEINLTATKEAEGFAFGEYQNGVNEVMIFNRNGTGSFISNGAEDSFTFTVSESGEVTVSSGIAVETESGKVKSFNRSTAYLKDALAGKWKKNTNSQKYYEFDGKNGVTYGTASGTYRLTEGGAVLSLGGRELQAQFNDDGALIINGEAYFPADGYTGGWYGRLIGEKPTDVETVDITFNGIGRDGYGEATIVYYIGTTQTIAAEYAVTKRGVMRIYVGDMLYGELQLNASTGALGGNMLSYKDLDTRGIFNYKSVSLNVYDLFKGVWACNADGIKTVNFTGKGGEDGGAIAIITGANGKVTEERYSTTSANAGKITINGKDYAMAMDEDSGKIALSADGGLSGMLARRDSWYGVTLYDGETAYTFDGAGNLSGTVTVSGGANLVYTVTDGAMFIDNKPVTVTPSGYVWNGKTLAFKTGFAGTWLKPVTNEEITVTEVTGGLTATVTEGGNEYIYTYDPLLNTLSYSSADLKGKLTTTTLSLSGGVELAVTVTGLKAEDYVCVNQNNLDGWKGEYAATDGSKWEFDGHGLSKYASGTAVYTDKDGVKHTYDYRQNVLGMIYIFETGVAATTQTGMVFAQTDGEGYKKEGSQTAYKPVTADATYLYEVRFGEEYLVFDGAGSFWKNGDAGYAKVDGVSYKSLDLYCSVVEGLAGSGVKSIATLSSDGEVTKMELSDYTEWTKAGSAEKYVFDTRNGLWRLDGEGFTRVYTYTELSTENSYGLEDGDGKLFIMTLNPDDNTFELVEKK